MRLVPIVAIELLGPNCFYSTMALNEPWKEMYGEEVRATDIKIVKKERGLRIAQLRNPKSRLTSLGPASLTLKIVSRAMVWMGEVTCAHLPNERMLNAISFAGNGTLFSHLQCNH